MGKAISSRRAMIVRIAVLGLLAILSAAILVVYILRDIKRERRDRQRILEAKTETERIMQQRERLLLTITHDIKAPAAAIAGFIDLLSEYVDRPKAVGYLQSISGSANHLLQLVSALLDYHKLESGKAERHWLRHDTRRTAERVQRLHTSARRSRQGGRGPRTHYHSRDCDAARRQNKGCVDKGQGHDVQSVSAGKGGS